MKRIIYFMLLVIMLFSSTCLANDRYQWIASDDRMGFFFDTKTIEFEKNIFTGQVNYSVIRVWIKTVYTEKGVDEIVSDMQASGLDPGMQRYLSYAMDRYEINRDANTIRLTSGTDYKENGTVIRTYPAQPYAKNILPESNGELWRDAVCKYADANRKFIPAR